MQIYWVTTYSISEINWFQIMHNGSNKNPLVSGYLPKANWFLFALFKLNVSKCGITVQIKKKNGYEQNAKMHLIYMYKMLALQATALVGYTFSSISRHTVY